MKFYDLGDNDLDMASPYRLHIAEEGIDARYGVPGCGAVVFVTVEGGGTDDYGADRTRCIFGLNGETHHEDLKKRLEYGEHITMRGVLWPKFNAVAVWQTFRDMHEFRGCMEVLDDGLSNQLKMNPENVTVYMGFSNVDNMTGGFDCFNVGLSVREACMCSGYGDLLRVFTALYEKDKKTRQKTDGKVAPNGMSSRDLWRHYEVVGEGKGHTFTITGKDLRKMVTEAVKRIMRQRIMRQR
jgi:hypothetical protein